VEGPCEHCNESSGLIKFWQILDCLLNLQLLKKNSVLWSPVSLYRVFCQETTNISKELIASIKLLP
jgi:hypothetical protein